MFSSMFAQQMRIQNNKTWINDKIRKKKLSFFLLYFQLHLPLKVPYKVFRLLSAFFLNWQFWQLAFFYFHLKLNRWKKYGVFLKIFTVILFHFTNQYVENLRNVKKNFFLDLTLISLTGIVRKKRLKKINQFLLITYTTGRQQ